MTTPPGTPATPAPDITSDATEPVPTFATPHTSVEPGPALGPDPASRPPAPSTVRPAPAGSSRVLNLALGVALLVAAAGVSFAVGRATAPATTPTGAPAVVPGGFPGNGGVFPDASFDPNGNGGRPGGGQGVPGGFGGFGGGLTITGTVDSVSATSITVKLEDGRTMTVGLDGSTTYHRQADAGAADVTAGKTVSLQLSGGFRPGQGGTGTGSSTNLGAAGSVTIIP